MLHFHKYEGAGNDFVLIDAREKLPFALDDQPTIAKLCDRHFGIGADGLMLLKSHPYYDFEMIYYNADGHPSSMCGNGGRCIVAFAQKLGIIENKCRFIAVDGPHEASLLENGNVSLGMSEVREIEQNNSDFVLNTGSPHFVRFQEEVGAAPLLDIAKSIRYGERFKAVGINVNLVKQDETGTLIIRTYERGVEDETLACGTGITAAAISQAIRDGFQANKKPFTYQVQAIGGQLSVSGRWLGDRFGALELTGPATYVFSGQISI